jgi:hypothetical protein
MVVRGKGRWTMKGVGREMIGGKIGGGGRRGFLAGRVRGSVPRLSRGVGG